MVEELDLQLALERNESRKTGSLPVYDMHRLGAGGSNLGQTQSWEELEISPQTGTYNFFSRAKILPDIELARDN